MYSISGVVSGKELNDIGIWDIILAYIGELISGNELLTVNRLLQEERSVYIAGSNFWFDIKGVE